jgi:ABC-2 type transport system permease protein
MRPGACAAVARTAFADRIAWRGDAFLGAFMSAVRVALALILWVAIFDGRAEVGGMSLRVMASYCLVAIFFFHLDQSGPTGERLAGEIRAGAFGSYLARPVEPLKWFLAASAGRSAFQAAIAAIAILAVGAAMGLMGPGAGSLLAPLDPVGALAALPVLASGLLSLALLNFMTAILAFRFQDVTAFRIVQNCAVEFLSGALIPLALMPSWARTALKMTPFPALASLPAELAIGRGLESLPGAAAVLAAWNLGLYAAARAMHASLSRRYEEFGS